VVQDNWQRGVPLNVYGLIYDIRDGILKDTGIYLNSLESYNSFNADFWKKRVLPKVK
jgi:carbonic anhydrase